MLSSGGVNWKGLSFEEKSEKIAGGFFFFLFCTGMFVLTVESVMAVAMVCVMIRSLFP